jgi:hypothetical protein
LLDGSFLQELSLLLPSLPTPLSISWNQWVLERSVPQSRQGLSCCAKGCTLYPLDDAWTFDTARTLSYDLPHYEKVYDESSQEKAQYLSTPVHGFWMSS